MTINQVIDESGYTKSALANALHLSMPTLKRKLADNDFSMSEVSIISEVLHIDLTVLLNMLLEEN